MKPADRDKSRDDDEEALGDGSGRREAERGSKVDYKKRMKKEEPTHNKKSGKKEEINLKCSKERRSGKSNF